MESQARRVWTRVHRRTAGRDTTRFLDPQNGSIDCSDYFQKIMPKGWTYIMRVDDKEPTELIIDR